MEQLRAILLWAVAISIAVIIAGVATGSMTFHGQPAVPPAPPSVAAPQHLPDFGSRFGGRRG